MALDEFPTLGFALDYTFRTYILSEALHFRRNNEEIY